MARYANYNKKRARELKQDKFRDTTMSLFDRLGDKLEGKGRTILYAIAAVIALGIIAGIFVNWRARKTDEARRAMGRAIEIATAPVTTSPLPDANTPTFPSETARAQRAVEEFQKVADKYTSSPFHETALYFIATNRLAIDRNKGISELEALTKSSDQEISILARFALGQAKEADGKYDEAATIYSDLAKLNSTVITPEVANFRLASVYQKQGKKQEAAELFFNIAKTAREAKDSENKPKPQSAVAREAAQELQKLDPARYAQLPQESPGSDLAS